MERCFNISQFLTTTHIMPNMDHHFFLALLVNQTNRYLGPWLWMVEFSLFLIRQVYRLFGIKFKCPDYGRKYHSHPSYCCIRDDLFRTQILHNIILQIIYFTLLKVLTFLQFFEIASDSRGDPISWDEEGNQFYRITEYISQF